MDCHLRNPVAINSYYYFCLCMQRPALMSPANSCCFSLGSALLSGFPPYPWVWAERSVTGERSWKPWGGNWQAKSALNILWAPDPLSLKVCSNPAFIHWQLVPLMLLTIFFAVIEYLREKEETLFGFIVSEVWSMSCGLMYLGLYWGNSTHVRQETERKGPATRPNFQIYVPKSAPLLI